MTAPWRGQVWLNPPRAEAPDVQFLMLTAREVAVLHAAVEAARKTAIDDGDRSVLADISGNLKYGGLPPTDDRISRESSHHPANQLSRLMPAVLDHLTRWAGGECVVANAIEWAAGVEAALNGWEGVETVARAAHHRAWSATECAYGRVTPPGTHLVRHRTAGGQFAVPPEDGSPLCHVHLDEPEDGCLGCHPGGR